MKIMKSVLSCLLAGVCLSAGAQGKQPKTENVFNPHWYVELQPLGAQYTLGETSFGDLVSYNVQAGVGYRFNPVFGLRLSFNAWQSKGGWEMDNLKETWKWKYVAPMVDAKFNISNLLCGYNPDRLFSFSLLAGLGANIAWGNDDAQKALDNINAHYGALAPESWDNNQNLRYLWDGTKVRFAGRVGAAADFRLSDKVSLGLELQANGVNDRYNSKKAGNIDWYFNALAGVKINLGKTHTTREVKCCKSMCAEPRVVERVVEKVVEKPVQVPAAQPETVEPLRRDVFFTINSTTVSAKEKQKVTDVANYLNKYPKAKVTVTGYADRGTGNKAINSRLSQNRARTVTNMLVKEYGISRDRIVTDYKGDTVQPFSKDSDNRVSICIAQ